MSLTSFLQCQDVKERFRSEFAMPKTALRQPLLAPPLSNRYALVGTAFDYLMRFYLKRLNPNAQASPWVAQQVFSPLLLPFSPLFEPVATKRDTVVSYRENELGEKAHQILEQAEANYSHYLASGELTDSLIESALRLAQLDPIIRAGVVGQDLGTVHQEDVEDLRKLISLVDPPAFTASQRCLLNPTFGKASSLVHGADADLVIDDAIIEIKTTKDLQLKRKYFDELMGYFVLDRIEAMSSPDPRPGISKVGIYFSRYAYLYIMDLAGIVRPDTLPSFMDWFVTRAQQEYAAEPASPGDSE